jgi:hypothetical protein
MKQEGSASVVVLSVLIFLSALFLGAVTFIELSAHGLRRSQRQEEEARALRQAAEATIQALLADPTPFADAPTDPVWSWLAGPRNDGLTIRLEDVSSRPGLNWIRRELLADLKVLKPGRTVQELQQFREDTGILLNLYPAFEQFIAKEDMERWFTQYGYFNINITDEFVLRKLHEQRGADLQAAETFRIMVQQVRIQKRSIDSKALPEFLGDANYRLLFPVVNAEAAMNIHFVPEHVLEALFRHYGQPVQNVSRILEARRGAELTQSGLASLLGERADQHGPLWPFLGLQTWFWRISAEGSSQRLTWIVARTPRADGLLEFRRLEERIEP